MKRVYILIFLLLSSCSLIFLNFEPVSASLSVSEIYEDFESWNDNSWDSWAGYPDINSTAAYEGSYGAFVNYITGTEGISSPVTNNSLTLGFMMNWYDHDYSSAGSRILVDAFWNVAAQSPRIEICTVNNYDNYYYWQIGIFGDGTPGYQSNSTHFDLDTWYMINITITSGKVKLWVDGEINLNLDYGEYIPPEDEIERCYIGKKNGNYAGVLFYDDVYWLSYHGYFNISADLEDIDNDGADWVFTNWKYYNFTLEYYTDEEPSNVSIGFNVPTPDEYVMGGFYAASSGNYIYASNMTYEDRYGEPFKLQQTAWDYDESSETLTASFFIWFDSLILDVWEPGDAIDVYWQYENSGWIVGEEDFFRIYNEGGFSLNTESSDDTYAELMTGGTPFSFHVEDDGGTGDQWMYNEVWYRDAEHIKLLPDVKFFAGLDDFKLVFGMDYSLGNGSWQQGYKLNVQPDFVSYTGILASNVWINHTVTHSDWDNNLISAYGDEELYMFYHGSVASEGDPGRWRMWIDLWFSDRNASSCFSGRCNAYEFPMNDNADLWIRWLGNNWGVKDDVAKENQATATLIDPDDGNRTAFSQEIKMVRYWLNVTVYSEGGGQVIEIPVWEVWDVSHSKDMPLTGIANPVFDETLMPTVGQRGLLGALFSAFANLGAWLSDNIIFGGLSLWDNFVNFLDSVGALWGDPKFFTNLFTWLAEFLGYLADSVSYIGEIAGTVFDLFASLLGAFLDQIVDLVTSLVNTITIFTDMMGGAYGVGVDVWEDLGVAQWITVAFIFYPLYLVILWDESGMGAVIEQLSWLFGIVNWLFHFLLQIVNFVIGIVQAIIESIPVVE